MPPLTSKPMPRINPPFDPGRPAGAADGSSAKPGPRENEAADPVGDGHSDADYADRPKGAGGAGDASSAGRVGRPVPADGDAVESR